MIGNGTRTGLIAGLAALSLVAAVGVPTQASGGLGEGPWRVTDAPAEAIAPADALEVSTGATGPLSTWEMLDGRDCLRDTHNVPPGHPDHDPEIYDEWGDPRPGTQAWDERDAENEACAGQRDHDRRFQPVWPVTSAQYGEDWYRQPPRFDGVRWHFDYLTQIDIPDVPSAEIYRPCTSDPNVCPDLPAELRPHHPPYPVVVLFHGFIAQKSHHRYTAQALAEAGYMAISVNGTLPAGSAPNVQRQENGADVLDWLHAQEHPIAQQSDLERVAFAGHSQGGSVTMSYEDDPRVHAMIIWDSSSTPSEDGEHPKPVMYQRTDGDFASPATYDDYPDDRFRAQEPYESAIEQGTDVFHFTARATSHVAWNGYGSGLDGNRLAELLINYYNLAWIDRHLKGRLAFDDDGEVITYDGRTEAEERAYRQAHAREAYERLIAETFDDSADRHNISMGFFDPVKLVTSGDELYGGNVPYRVEGSNTTDRFAYYYRSLCSVSVPDYVNGATGLPGDPDDPVAARAATGTDLDMRHVGCPEIEDDETGNPGRGPNGDGPPGLSR